MHVTGLNMYNTLYCIFKTFLCLICDFSKAVFKDDQQTAGNYRVETAMLTCNHRQLQLLHHLDNTDKIFQNSRTVKAGRLGDGSGCQMLGSLNTITKVTEAYASPHFTNGLHLWVHKFWFPFYSVACLQSSFLPLPIIITAQTLAEDTSNTNLNPNTSPNPSHMN